MAVLVVAEHNHSHLKTATVNTITAASQLAANITVLVAGFNCRAVAEQAANIAGVKQVLLADTAAYQHHLAENLTDLIVSYAKDYQYVLAPATSYGKNLMPRVAALLDVDQISDVCAIIDAHT